MRNLLKVFFLFFLYPQAWTSHAYMLVGLDLGSSLLTYSETFSDDSSKNLKVVENAVSVNLHTQIGLLSSWMYIKANVQYSALPFAYKGAKHFSQLNQTASLSIVLPSRPFNVTLVAEQFYTQMFPNEKSFGYTSLQGVHFFPYADYTTAGGITFFLKYPLFSFLDQRQELRAGVIFRFGNSGGSYPEVLYEEAYVLKLIYSNITLDFKSAAATAQSVTNEILVSLGYIF